MSAPTKERSDARVDSTRKPPKIAHYAWASDSHPRTALCGQILHGKYPVKASERVICVVCADLHAAATKLGPGRRP